MHTQTEKCCIQTDNGVFYIGEYPLSRHSPIPVMRVEWRRIKYQTAKYSRLDRDFVNLKAIVLINGVFYGCASNDK